jgi:hypothetical protein
MQHHVVCDLSSVGIKFSVRSGRPSAALATGSLFSVDIKIYMRSGRPSAALATPNQNKKDIFVFQNLESVTRKDSSLYIECKIK